MDGQRVRRLITALLKSMVCLALVGSFVVVLTLSKMDQALSRGTRNRRVNTITDDPSWLVTTPYQISRKSNFDSPQQVVPSSKHVCIRMHGGLGNQLWMYAIAYYVHAKYGHVLHADISEIAPFFNVTPTRFHNVNASYCPVTRQAKYDVGYDPNLLSNISSINVNLDGYFQSYEYWFDLQGLIRREFTFTPPILEVAKKMLFEAAFISSVRGPRVTYVGVHVRRGDFMKETHFFKFGYVVATEQYLHKATSYFDEKYKIVTFVVISNDIPWTKKLFKGRDNFVFIQGSKREIDMAALTLCDHTIMTVGTFGWWTAFLTHGEVVYFKHTRRLYTGLDNVTSPDDTEFFFPGWIGMT